MRNTHAFRTSSKAMRSLARGFRKASNKTYTSKKDQVQSQDLTIEPPTEVAIAPLDESTVDMWRRATITRGYDRIVEARNEGLDDASIQRLWDSLFQLCSKDITPRPLPPTPPSESEDDTFTWAQDSDDSDDSDGSDATNIM